MADASQDTMTRDEAMTLMGRLLAGVPAGRLPLVAAQAVWGMGPWSSRTPYVRAMAAWVAGRFRDDLPAVPRALTLAACGRATLADRRFIEAIEECEAALDEAERGGDDRVVRACRALLARALLHNGEVARGLEVLGDVTDADLPPALRPEVLLALGVADIVRGDPERAAARFAEAAGAAEGPGGDSGSTAQWHRAMALAGQAHAVLRAFRFAEAIPFLEAAASFAQEDDAHREVADLQALRAVCALATGAPEPAKLSAALTAAFRAAGAAPGADFLMGFPADLAGSGSALEAANRLEEAATERLRVRDEAGFLIAVLGCALFLGEGSDRATAGRILAPALEAAGNLEWHRARGFLLVARAALELT